MDGGERGVGGLSFTFQMGFTWMFCVSSRLVSPSLST